MTCAFCSQPEGHTGVCGRVQETKPPAKLVGRPKVAKFENGLIAQLALFDDSTLQVWWLTHGKWERGQQMLEPLWQIEPETRGTWELVTITARLGSVVVQHSGHYVNRHDSAKVLRKHPTPFGSDWSKADEAEWRDDDADLKAERAENAALKGE